MDEKIILFSTILIDIKRAQILSPFVLFYNNLNSEIIKNMLQLFLTIFLFSHLCAKTESKVKVFENGVLVGEISTIQNKKLFSVNDLIEITKSNNFINDKTQKVVFYVDNKK